MQSFRLSLHLLMLLVLAQVLSVPVALAAHVETADFARVYDEVRTQERRYGAANVLVAFDLDNTLLANRQDLGTDQWFEWQKSLIENHRPDAVASDIGGLIAAQSVLYTLGRMRPTEPGVAAYVRRMQSEGASTIVLTARDGASRDATRRELLASGLDFRQAALSPGFAGEYLPYQVGQPVQSGFTQEEATRWSLRAPRPVSYMDGIYMVSGQHKGAMLRALLHKTGKTFAAIVFVDDKEKNNANVAAGFAGTGVDVTTIRYTREDAAVARFEADSKQTVIRQWKALAEVRAAIF